ncbi:hypothetical protein ZEAMMB73_Zm00001d045768 [Zea mays]|uniref:Uncharacterized protein n=1 Tax=Zea mays TaxID=4577 RepID=A0A1D6NYU2_MAIZE|nr:hypothetical protein ZEAMMB73_Zm00001d045768 [Zea mays]
MYFWYFRPFPSWSPFLVSTNFYCTIKYDFIFMYKVFVFVAAECENPHDSLNQKTDICEGEVPWAPHSEFCQALPHHGG